jgi:G2/mitotic-specific cyclin-B, other
LACDIEDSNNSQAVAEYASDCLKHMMATEETYKPTAECLSNQKDLKRKMRVILVGWLIDVHLKFKLLPETLFLTINLIDRYCEKKQILRGNYQLLGVTAMLIASKYEEIYAPEIRDCVYITDKAYTKE